MTVNKTRPPTALVQHHPAVGARSRTGTRDHDNDDSYDYFVVERADGGGAVYVAIVADGVTNTAGGAQASRIAVEAVKATLQESPGRQETLSEWLEFAITHANEEILFQAKRNPQWQGMSTTIVLAALAGEKLYVMHLGDSRAYLIRGNAIYQLVADHTWAQEAINMGVLTVEEAAQHPGRNQLLRYLGAQKGLGVDRGIIVPATTRREEYLAAQPGDAILLCSDGLHNRVSDAELKQAILEHVGYPQDAVDALLEKAVEKGERDDITAIVLELPPGHKELPNGVDAPTPSVAPVPTKNGFGLWLLLTLVGVLALLAVLLLWLRLG
ncbi:MAG: protein phosphatase 2C domain-containing protein [Chloroflexi bacterium]|nr:protein phosphatase 2C domain-containing protein [Chloroflexota bacterium]